MLRDRGDGGAQVDMHSSASAAPCAVAPHLHFQSPASAQSKMDASLCPITTRRQPEEGMHTPRYISTPNSFQPPSFTSGNIAERGPHKRGETLGARPTLTHVMSRREGYERSKSEWILSVSSQPPIHGRDLGRTDHLGLGQSRRQKWEGRGEKHAPNDAGTKYRNSSLTTLIIQPISPPPHVAHSYSGFNLTLHSLALPPDT